MKKFVLVHNGKEVKMGDTLVKQSAIDTPFGKIVVLQEITVTEQSIPELITADIIKPVEGPCCGECAKEVVPMDIAYYVHKIAKRLGWHPNKVANHLNAIDTIYPSAAFNVIMREIATELDLKYADHIYNSPKIYVVSSLDGRITEANKAHIRNYKNFAAFRSIEDAKIACRITRDILKEMFKSGK